MDALNMLSVPMNNMVKLLSKQIRVDSSSTTNVGVVCCNICGEEHDTNTCVECE